MSVNTTASVILFGVFAGLLILRVPITFSLLASSIAAAYYLNVPLMTIVQQMVQGVNTFSLLAIPFFIIAGDIMGSGGISRRLIAMANVFVGRITGGLSLINVLACMFFGSISGSAVAGVSSVGSIMIPMMKSEKYDDDFTVGLTVASATQGVMIPPSHNMILYSVAAGGVSVGGLFLGGILPGITLGIGLMIAAYIISKKRGYPKQAALSFKESSKAILGGILGLLTAIIILGGVISGIFTATESAAIAVLYAFILTFFVYREIPLSAMNAILFRSLKTLAMVMSLIAAAKSFGWVMSYVKIPELITNMLLDISGNKIVIILLVNVLLLILGCVMDMGPLILIVTPTLYPIMVHTLGMDPVHFGLMLIMNLSIGLCTPPIGAALFVGSAIGRVPIVRAARAMVPFYFVLLIVLMLVTFIPELSLYLPAKFLGN